MASLMMSASSQLGVSARLPARPARISTKTLAVARPQASKKELEAGNVLVKAPLLATIVVLGSSASARAEDVQVDSAIDSIIGVVKTAGDFVKASISSVQAGYEVVKEGYDVIAPVVQKGVDFATPVVTQVLKTTSDAAAPALKSALPALQSTATGALQSTGVSVTTVSKTVSDATTAVSPFVAASVNFLTTTDPVLLAEYGVGAVVFYFLGPPVLGTLFGSLRGYAGELSAVSALETLNSDSSSLLVDIRSSKEKEAGVPDVPSGTTSRVLEVEYAATEDRRLRSQLRDPTAIEAQITALQISSLKRASTGSKIILLDKNGGQARGVAQELSRKGYSKVYIISGGFEGGNGWVKSKLQIKPSSGKAAGNSSPFFGTVTTSVNRKSLPAPKSA